MLIVSRHLGLSSTSLRLGWGGGQCGAEGAAWSQEAWALMDALWLTHCVTCAGHNTSLQMFPDL